MSFHFLLCKMMMMTILFRVAVKIRDNVSKKIRKGPGAINDSYYYLTELCNFVDCQNLVYTHYFPKNFPKSISELTTNHVKLIIQKAA